MADPRFLQINQDGVLSIPVSLWWCSLLLLRYSLLLVVALASAAVGAGSYTWVFGVVSWPGLVCEAPMWVLVIAAARRSPQAGMLVRWVWRRGRVVLSLAAGLQLAWTLWILAQREVWHPWPERFMFVLALLDLAVLFGIWRSTLYRQLFLEFPERAAPRVPA
jgi:hypothetical protein